MKSESTQILTSNDEWFSVREAMRSLNQIVGKLGSGELEKAVLTRHGKMVAVILPIERFE